MFVNNKNHSGKSSIGIALVYIIFLSPIFFVVAEPADRKIHPHIYEGACDVDASIQAGSSQEPPTINEIYPLVLRAGYIAQVSLKGVGLANANISTGNHDLVVNSIRSTNNQVVFDLIVNRSAARGSHELTVTTPLGKATFEMILSSQSSELLSATSSTSSRGVYSPITDATEIASPEPSAAVDNDLHHAAGCDLITASTPEFPVFASEITVVKGSGITRTVLSSDSGTTRLVVHGVGLNKVDSLSIIPSDNLTVGDLTVNTEGSRVTSTIIVEPHVKLSQRRVVLSVAGERVVPLSVAADSIYVGGQPPVVDSVDPAVIRPGAVATLTLRGSHLQQARSVFVLPAGDMHFANQPIVNDDGTQLTIDVAVAASAVPSSRVIAVATPTGISLTGASPANTLTINESGELQSSTGNPEIEPIVVDHREIQPIPIAVNQSNETQEKLPVELSPKEQEKNYYGRHIGVVKGATLYNLYPKTRPVGSNFTLTLQGVGLQKVDGIKFVPAKGITSGAIMTSASGNYLTVDVAIDTDTSVTSRQVQLMQNGRVIPVVTPGRDRLSITAPQPFIESITPNVILKNNIPQLISLRGHLLNGLQQLRIEPSDGIRIDKLNFDEATKTASAEISVTDEATAGPKLVVVDTEFGSSYPESNPINIITVAGKINYSAAIVSSPLKVIKPPVSTPMLQESHALPTLLGVTVKKQVDNQPTINKYSKGGVSSLGVALGSVATAMTPSTASVDTSVILIINGSQLDNATDIQLLPNTGIITGSVLAGSRQISVPLTIAADAPRISRRVMIKANDSIIEFTDLAEGLLEIVE